MQEHAYAKMFNAYSLEGVFLNTRNVDLVQTAQHSIYPVCRTCWNWQHYPTEWAVHSERLANRIRDKLAQINSGFHEVSTQSFLTMQHFLPWTNEPCYSITLV